MLSERAWRERGRGYGASGNGTTRPEHRRGPNAATWSYGGRARSGGGGGRGGGGVRAGVRHFIAASWQRRAGRLGEGRGERSASRQPPAASRQPVLPLTVVGAVAGRWTVVMSPSALALHVCHVEVDCRLSGSFVNDNDY